MSASALERSSTERAALIGFAALAGLAAWGWFALHPSRVLVGTRALDELVPVLYQVTAFPPFAVVSGAWVADLLRRRAASSRWPLATLIALCSVVAVGRLAGGTALSGHAFFLSAVLLYDLISSAADRLPLVRLLASAGLLITAWFKLAVWHDAPWFLASCLLGSLAGGALGMWRRRQPRAGTA